MITIVPIALAAPAAVASLAYLNARTQFTYDIKFLGAVVKNSLRAKSLERKDRVNFFYVIEEHALGKSLADHAFIWYEGQSWTYKEVYDIVLKYAAWLKNKCAVAPNEVVALDFMNSPKFVFIWLAIWSLGATVIKCSRFL